jgi:dipeptidyl aminopeptidase/acylaminoacyl peptidase
MRAEDLDQLQIPSDPRLHPNGERVAFVVSQMDSEGDRYRRRIHIHDGGVARPFTAGPGDTFPRWSPDGTRLAFLRTGDAKDAKPQLAVIAVDGGESQTLTEFDLGVEYLAWSPDGRWLCVVAVTWTEEWEELSEEDRKRQPRRIRHFPYRFDNMGWLHDRRRHLWLIDPRGEEEHRCLTPGDFDETHPAWHPSGEKLAFVSDRDPRRGISPGTDVWELNIANLEVTRAAERGYWLVPTYRPDGVLHIVGNQRVDYPRLLGLWRREAERYFDITEHLDRSVTSILAGPGSDPRWVGDRAITFFEDSGRMEIVSISPDGSVSHLVKGDRTVTGFDIGSAERLVFTASVDTSPGDLYESAGDGERLLAQFPAPELAFISGQHWRVPTEGVEIDAFAYIPDGDGPFPVLLNIHGGPATQYGFGFFDEFQVYAEDGFAVVACNPRGSSGRGLDFVRSVVGDGWGVVDQVDVTAVLESALARFPQLDEERVGIMGGSYGGFLTAWLIARDHRYRSAIVERALTSYPSFAGTSDIAVQFPPNYTGSDDYQVWWEKSPLPYAEQIQTPTLILHSEGDLRCPIEQAEQLFLALLRAGVEAEFLRFPDEGHELSRSGKPRHRLERFSAVLDWHRRHLLSGGAAPVAN